MPLLLRSLYFEGHVSCRNGKFHRGSQTRFYDGCDSHLEHNMLPLRVNQHRVKNIYVVQTIEHYPCQSDRFRKDVLQVGLLLHSNVHDALGGPAYGIVPTIVDTTSFSPSHADPIPCQVAGFEASKPYAVRRYIISATKRADHGNEKQLNFKVRCIFVILQAFST